MFFEYPKLLWLLALVPLAILIYIWREIKGRHPYLTVSDITPWKLDNQGFFKRMMRHVPFILRCIAIAALVIAIARPRSASELEKVSTMDLGRMAFILYRNCCLELALRASLEAISVCAM